MTAASAPTGLAVGGKAEGVAQSCALDPATAILEAAVHNGFETLETVGFVLTVLQILDPALVHIVGHAEVRKPNWLVLGIPSAGQQAFGDGLMALHLLVARLGTVSFITGTWSLTLSVQQALTGWLSRGLLR